MDHKAAAAAGRAIKLAVSQGSFKASDVRQRFAHPPSDATIRRVLRQLEADDWLRRDTDGSSIWRAGLQARTLGDMSDRALDDADREPVQPGEETDADPFDFSL
jgi:hypothetical protein